MTLTASRAPRFPWWGHLLVLLALVGSVVGQVVGAFFLAFVFSTCRSFPLDRTAMLSGQVSVLLLVGVTAACWTGLAVLTRYRYSVLVSGALSTGLGAAIAVWALTSDTWHQGFCF